MTGLFDALSVERLKAYTFSWIALVRPARQNNLTNTVPTKNLQFQDSNNLILLSKTTAKSERKRLKFKFLFLILFQRTIYLNKSQTPFKYLR